jgi:uncharacterized protein
MNIEDIIIRTIAYVKETLHAEGSGHDWWHIYRVWSMAKTIAREEQANMLVVELAALLHDIADWKAYDGDASVGPRVAGEWLHSIAVEPAVIAEVQDIIPKISFKGVADDKTILSPEAKIVQDADRLDAIGAVGIARVFTYGGSKGRVIYDPTIPPVKHESVESYLKNENPSVNHFYEKLLLLKDLMNTETGRRIAAHRHAFMESYLNEFYKEWDGVQ